MAKDVKEFVGFVVNIFNTLNYDIDLGVTDPGCGPIDTNHYTYQDECTNTEKTGLTHRCRLTGILRKINGTQDGYVQSMRSVVHHINRLNGWVIVRTFGTDKYRRLLVELVDPISGVSINQMLVEMDQVYVPYREPRKRM